jgi:hypothetical protein
VCPRADLDTLEESRISLPGVEPPFLSLPTHNLVALLTRLCLILFHLGRSKHERIYNIA